MRNEVGDDDLDLILARRRRLQAQSRKRRTIIIIACGVLLSGGLVAIGVTIAGRKELDRAGSPIADSSIRKSNDRVLVEQAGVGGQPATGSSTSNSNDKGQRTTIAGTIVRFYLGDDALEFIKAAQGENSDLKPALELRTARYGKIDCRFLGGQEERLAKLSAGDAITVEGDLQELAGGVVMLRNCRVISSRR